MVASNAGRTQEEWAAKLIAGRQVRGNCLVAVVTDDPVGAPKRGRVALAPALRRSIKDAGFSQSVQDADLSPNVWFGSRLELLFLLAWLNGKSGTDHDRAPTLDPSTLDRMHAARSSPPAAWGAAAACGALEVLFTSGFPPDAIDRVHCLAAANDLGKLMSIAPIGSRFHVLPAITRDRLRVFLEERSHEPGHVRVWVHSSHGDWGVQEADLSPVADPRTWRDIFLARDALPDVVVLLACRTGEMARLFAERGATAVGFDGAVNTERARLLAAEVLLAVRHHGFAPRAILHGFSRGLLEYRGSALVGAPDAQPVAYYSGL